MSLTKNPRRPRKPRAADIPAEYVEYAAVPPLLAPDRGATLNLQDPKSFINWLSSNADGFQLTSEKLREKSREHWTAAAEHDRQAQALDAQIEQVRGQLDKLAKQIDELAAQREAEQQKQKMRAAEATQFDDRAQNSENAAADIHASIPVLQQAMDNANGNGQAPPTTPTPGTAPMPVVPVDPTDERIDKSLANMDAARAELPADQREEDGPL
jgi:TolA-binding protein